MGYSEQDNNPGLNMFANFTDNLREQAENPPGQDRIMGACYKATVELIDNNQEFRDFISDVLSQRQMVPHHFTNLYFRSIQFLEMFRESNKGYPTQSSFKDNVAWQDTILGLKEKYESEWKDLLLTKDTTTTIYQRYAGAKIVLNALFPNKNLNVADFGCGANYGLRGLAQGLPFNDFEDQTPEAIGSRLSNSELKITDSLAVDRENPDDPDAKLWRLACSFYPHELINDGMKKLLDFESKLECAGRVQFLQGDLLNLDVNHRDGTLPAEKFDAVILNTMLYQMDDGQQNKVIESARKSLNPNGVIIIQDFAVKDSTNPHKLDFNVNWGQKGMYRTFIASNRTNWQYKEVLRWENGRCKKLQAGEDFNFLPKP